MAQSGQIDTSAICPLSGEFNGFQPNFPAQRNREFLNAYQGIDLSKQGIFKRIAANHVVRGDLLWLATQPNMKMIALSDKSRRGEQAHERSPTAYSRH
jgi:hypothetical protein